MKSSFFLNAAGQRLAAAHRVKRLPLLPSGPDGVHTPRLRGAANPTAFRKKKTTQKNIPEKEHSRKRKKFFARLYFNKTARKTFDKTFLCVNQIILTPWPLIPFCNQNGATEKEKRFHAETRRTRRKKNGHGINRVPWVIIINFPSVLSFAVLSVAVLFFCRSPRPPRLRARPFFFFFQRRLDCKVELRDGRNVCCRCFFARGSMFMLH